MPLKRRDDWIPKRVDKPQGERGLIPEGKLPEKPELPNNAANHTRRIFLAPECTPKDEWVPCNVLGFTSNDNDLDNDLDNDTDSVGACDTCDNDSDIFVA